MNPSKHVMCIIITIIVIFNIINISIIILNLNNSDFIPPFSPNFKPSVAARKSVPSAATADVSIDNCEAFTEGGEEKKNDVEEENKDEHSDENDDKKRRKTFHDIKEEKQQRKRGGIKAPAQQII